MIETAPLIHHSSSPQPTYLCVVLYLFFCWFSQISPHFIFFHLKFLIYFIISNIEKYLAITPMVFMFLVIQFFKIPKKKNEIAFNYKFRIKFKVIAQWFCVWLSISGWPLKSSIKRILMRLQLCEVVKALCGVYTKKVYCQWWCW